MELEAGRPFFRPSGVILLECRYSLENICDMFPPGSFFDVSIFG